MLVHKTQEHVIAALNSREVRMNPIDTLDGETTWAEVLALPTCRGGSEKVSVSPFPSCKMRQLDNV